MRENGTMGYAPTVEPFEVDDRPISSFRVGYDDFNSDQSTVTITGAADAEPVLRLGQFMVVPDSTAAGDYLLRVTGGPFFPPPFDPNTRPESRYMAAIVGRDEDGVVDVLSGRPRPNLAVEPLEANRSSSIIGANGDLRMGVLHTDPSVVVGLSSGDKRILPRNVGVFGTVGSGKSNTTQVLVEEASAGGWAVVVVDVEGEYVKMGRPATTEAIGSDGPDPKRPPRGIDDLRLLLPAAAKKAGRPKGTRLFTVPVSGYPLELLGGLLEVSEAQRRLLHRVANGLSEGYSLEDLIQAVADVWLDDRRQATTRDILLNRLELLARTGLFDDQANRRVDPLDVDELVAPGRVTVVDVSDLNDRTRNLTLGYLLQSLFRAVEGVPLGGKHANGPRPPVMLVMEEVQTFFGASDETRDVVLSFLQEVARRGRKRWLSLVAVSQQPSALPAGFFELLNTRIVHQTRSQPNLAALRRSCGDVHEDTWRLVTRLGPGQCILSGPAVRDAEVVRIRPASSQRLLTS